MISWLKQLLFWRWVPHCRTCNLIVPPVGRSRDCWAHWVLPDGVDRWECPFCYTGLPRNFK